MKLPLVSHARKMLISDSEGGALVEMAVTLPILMLILTGIVSFSFTLYQKLQLAEAVSNAGHYLATARGDSDPCAKAIQAVIAGAPGLASSSMNITLSDNGSALATSCPSSAGSALTRGDVAQVTASYPTGLAIYGWRYTTFNLGSQITEVVQ